MERAELPWSTKRMAEYKLERYQSDPEYAERKREINRAFRERNIYEIRRRDRIAARNRRNARRQSEATD